MNKLSYIDFEKEFLICIYIFLYILMNKILFFIFIEEEICVILLHITFHLILFLFTYSKNLIRN